MCDVLFFEKPGCINNCRQKAMLRELGHRVLDVDLLLVPWSKQGLRTFFGDRPVEQWFNPAAPRVKSGELRPDYLNEQQALDLLVEDRLLIRRPLIQCRHGFTAGFDDGDPVLSGLGVGLDVGLEQGQDLQSCPRSHEQRSSPEQRAGAAA